MADDYQSTIRPDDNQGTIRPDNAQSTIRPDNPQAFAPDRTMHIDAMTTSGVMADTERTLRPVGGEVTEVKVPKEVRTFLLKGDTYEWVRTLSESSGEAQVFLVRRQGDTEEFVLKVYYPNFDINKKLMQVVRNFQFEMIVELFDYGKTYVEGKHRYYELMEYLRGGTLRELRIDGDFNRFRRVALQGAAALAYCHHHDVLHKDIKPTNFFFRDEEQTQLVLGDFGISALKENSARTFHTTQARTPIYAAPEMYTDVIDGEVEITEAADYYSLGMTLFATWLGENPMSSNERIMMKQKSEGRLPRLDELPDKVKRLVQGLTAVNPQSRWDYEQVERWFQGEEVDVDLASPFLRYKNFIVDPDRNIVAENVHDLVPLLAEREQLAINYLYNGRIVQWLESSGNTRLSELLKDIIINKFPVDKKAGLSYALYTMDPTYPYIDFSGNACDDVHEVALSLLSQQENYAMLLKHPNSPLFLWLDTHVKCDVDRLRSYFAEGEDCNVGVLRMVYEIDPDIPFLSRHPSSTIKEITHSFGYSNPTEEEWVSLCDGRLLSWTYSHEDIMASESLRILTQGQPYSRQLAYKVLYNLDREAAYDLRDAHTPEGVGELLSHQLMQTEHLSDGDFAVQMSDYTDPDGRFHYFAQLHGWYDLMSEAHRCFDLNSPENRDRLSAYDLRTALYRFCRILGATPSYLLPSGSILQDGRSLDMNYSSLIRQELRTGSLAQWMSVFYHENPAEDFAEEYSYERELEEWIMALGRLDNQQTYYRRFTKACEDTKDRIAAVRSQWKKAKIRSRVWQYIFYALCVVWVLLVLVYGISDTGRQYIWMHKFLSVVLTLGSMTGVILGVKSYFKGLSPTLSFLLGIVGMASALLPAYLLGWCDSAAPHLYSFAIVGMTAIYIAAAHFTAFKEDRLASSEAMKDLLSNEDIKSSLLEPLYYTFKTKSHRYKSTKFGLIDDLSNQVNSMAGESVVHYILWSILVLVMVAEFILFSPGLCNMNLP